MKKLAVIIFAITYCMLAQAQDKLYLLFEFMKVDESQSTAYWETETFWSKIHEQRAKSGEILGWDLWSLVPGGEDQKFQYLTVTLYNDPVKMMNGTTLDALVANGKKAYPSMTNEAIRAKINASSKSRDLAVRVFLERIDLTEDTFEMKVGMITSIDMMKVTGDFASYEKAESEIFKPNHQKMVSAGAKGSWALARVIFPRGSDTYGSHMTFNFFKDWKHLFDVFNYDGGTPSAEMQKKIAEGLKTRDLRYSYMGKLEMMVRQ